MTTLSYTTPWDTTDLAAWTATTTKDVVSNVDVVILAIPAKGFAGLPDGLFDGVADDVVIVDTCNYYPKRDGRIDEIDHGKIESLWVSEQVGRPVVKAFNNVLSQVLETAGTPSGSPARIAAPVAGGDARARALVLGLVDTAGFDGVGAGDIEESWRQQPGTPVYCTDYDAAGVRAALASADRVLAPYHRDIVWDKFAQIPAGTEPAAFVDLVRTMSRSTH